MVCRDRSRCRSGFSLTKNTIGIGSLCVRDLQPGISERPEPSDASSKAQGAMEVAKERESSGEKTRFRVPRTKLLAP